jgi:hypothetical protein
MPYKIKTKQDETITVSEAELFRLFLAKAKASEELKTKIDSFVDVYSGMIPSEVMIKTSLNETMVTFFILGYQFANFELKNEVEYEQTISQKQQKNADA